MFSIENNDDLNRIPNGTTSLIWDIDVLPIPGDIPDSVNVLSFGSMFNQNLAKYDIIDYLVWFLFGEKSVKSHIPSSVNMLILCGPDHHLQVGHIPDSVTQLSLCGTFNNPLEVGHIPNSIVHLVLGGSSPTSFNQKLQIGLIPNSVINLMFDHSFNQKLETGHIPNSVINLTFKGLFDQKLEVGHIPDSVTNLTFGTCFNQPLKKGHIPDSVVCLSFGIMFNHVLEPEIIPMNLETLSCYHNHATILSKVPLYIKVYYSTYMPSIDLTNIRHLVRIRSGGLNDKIIDGEIKGVYYVNRVIENDVDYLLVHGDDYVYMPPAKSARGIAQ